MKKNNITYIKIGIIFAIFVVVIIMSLAILLNNNKGIISKSSSTYTPILNSDNTLKLDKGMEGGKIINTLTQKIINDNTIYTPETGNIIKNTFIYQQNLDLAMNFKLIVLADYIQIDFFVKGVKYDTYPFALQEEDSIFIDIEIFLDDRIVDEIEYLVVKDPDYNEIKQNEEDVLKRINLNSLSRYLFWQVRLSESSSKLNSIVYDNNWVDIFGEVLDLREVSLIKSRKIEPLQDRKDYLIPEDYFQPVYEINSSDECSLLINNRNKKETEYAVVQFLNWNQIPFEDGKTLKYLKLPSESFGQYKLELPSVNAELPYEVFAFRMPYRYEEQPSIQASERAIIKPR